MVSTLPSDIQRLIAQKTAMVPDPSMEDIINLTKLKLKTSVFRNVDVASQMVRFFEEGRFLLNVPYSGASLVGCIMKMLSEGNTNNVLVWSANRDKLYATLLFNSVDYFFESQSGIYMNDVRYLDIDGFASTQFNTEYQQSSKGYKKFLTKGWNFAFVVAAHRKFPEKLTKDICIQFLSKYPEADVFQKMLSAKVSPKTQVRASNLKKSKSKVPPTISEKTLRRVLPLH